MKTPQQFANQLNGCEIGNECDKAMEREARESGLVVVFGHSDDNTEFRGMLHDEIGAHQGATHRFDAIGFLPSDDDFSEHEETLERFGVDGACRKRVTECARIKAIWGEGDCSWSFSTTIPHAIFNVMEDGDVFCRGIVFRLSDAIKPQ